MARIRNWTKMSAADLWNAWQTQFGSADEATVTAIWMANRLVKDRAKSTRRKFYDIKDEFIRRNQNHLIEGRKVREEYAECWACDGTGKVAEFAGGGDCQRCNGTGKYRSRCLYLHVLDLEDRRYSFHSYVEPSRLSDEPGEDCERYGGRFTEEELVELALPVSGLIRILGYIAVQDWGMFRIDGRYYTSGPLK